MLLLAALAACRQENELPAAATAESPLASVESAGEPTQPAQQDPASESEAIEVTYFTPQQQEGPYYTVNKPDDRDNDLVDLVGASGAPEGQILEFGGRIYDADGLPVPGLTVEIWQTDADGVYLHPDDPGTAARDPNFQFYGEATTDEAGRYSFRTIIPGQYEPRPPHIHFKVKQDGQELLTSQFYFSEGIDEALLIATVAGQDADGSPILIGERDIVLNRGFSN